MVRFVAFLDSLEKDDEHNTQISSRYRNHFIYVASQSLLQKGPKKCPRDGVLLKSNVWASIAEAALITRDAP